MGGGWTVTHPSKLTGVYQIRNLVNGKLYIGSAAKSFHVRWYDHKHKLNKGSHHSVRLQRAWNKYGADSFVFEVLLVCEPSECLASEQVFLDRLCSHLNGYNVCPNAASILGLKRSDKTKEKMSSSQKGKKYGADARANMSAAAKKSMTPERRAKISKAARNISEETRAKMREAKKNISDETRAKMSACRKGKRLSDETRQRMSVARKGVKRSAEAIAKSAEGNIGRRHSAESLAKMSASQKRRPPFSQETRERLSASTKRIWEARRNKLATHRASNKEGDL